MSHIFISYSTRNSEYAHQFADELRAGGFNIWIDNAQLRSGDNWWNAIVAAIDECAAFIVIMTPDSRESKWVQRELGYADNWDKPLFPILLAGDNWPIFVGTQILDVRLDGSISPQYQGKLPSRTFYEQVAQFVSRNTSTGLDLAASSQYINKPIRDERLKLAIANPPPREDLKKQSSLSIMFIAKITTFLFIIFFTLFVYQTYIVIPDLQLELTFYRSLEFIVVDQREILGEVFNEQTGNIDNSTGTVILSQDISLLREFRHSIDLRLNSGTN